jgi:hypothetical protein
MHCYWSSKIPYQASILSSIMYAKEYSPESESPDIDFNAILDLWREIKLVMDRRFLENHVYMITTCV